MIIARSTSGQRALAVASLALASRNHPRVKNVDALAVNVYDVVDRTHIVFTERGLGRLTEILSS